MNTFSAILKINFCNEFMDFGLSIANLFIIVAESRIREIKLIWIYYLILNRKIAELKLLYFGYVLNFGSNI